MVYCLSIAAPFGLSSFIPIFELSIATKSDRDVVAAEIELRTVTKRF